MTTNKQSILQSATRILTNNPNISYKELAVALGIGRATLYRHFPKREELVKELILTSLQEIDDAMQPLLEQNLSSEAFLSEIIKVLIPMGEKFHLLSYDHWEAWQDPDIYQIYQRQNDEFAQLIDLMRYDGKISTDYPTVWIVTVFNNLIYTAWQSIQDGDIARNAAAKFVYDTFMNGFSQSASAS